MQNSYNKDLISESSQQLNSILASNKKMTENSLRMRAMAYLAQAKANLLTETIFEVEGNRRDIQKELTYKEEMLFAQSRHAAMGEMISMIAHQWRQPLTTISMDANNVLVDIELESLNEVSLKEDLEDILKQTHYLSKTIDDFRNFFKPNKQKDMVLVSDVFNDALTIIEKGLINSGLEVENSFHTTTRIEIFSRELIQVILNILKNAKEALFENEQPHKKITNKIYEDEQDIIIEIHDNGKGIKEEVIKKIFDPYFSTKDEKNGTGLGLYMSKVIVVKHLNGTITANNTQMGVVFVIKLSKLGGE